MMFIPMERMLTRWLTPITFSPCSRLVSYCMRLSSTQHPSLSPSDMVSLPTRSHSLTSHAYESALTRPPPSRPWLHLTLGHSHQMATSFATRDCSMSPTIRKSDWTSSALIMTIAWPDTLSSPDDQEHPSSVLLAPNGRLCHRLHPLVFGVQLQQVPPSQALWPSSFPPDRRTTMGLNLDGLHRGATPVRWA